jgi:hypothetical protein
MVNLVCFDDPDRTSELNFMSPGVTSAIQGARRSQPSFPSGNHGEYEVLVVFKARKDDAGHVKTD